MLESTKKTGQNTSILHSAHEIRWCLSVLPLPLCINMQDWTNTEQLK